MKMVIGILFGILGVLFIVGAVFEDDGELACIGLLGCIVVLGCGYSLIATSVHNHVMVLKDTIAYQEPASLEKVKCLDGQTALATMDEDGKHVILRYVTEDGQKTVVFNKKVRLGEIHISESDEAYVEYYKAQRFKRWTSYIFFWFIGDYDYVDIYVPRIEMVTGIT